MRPRPCKDPGAFDYPCADICSPPRVCFLSSVHGGWGGGGAHWGVGQLADRPAVNREVGGSSPPAPVLQVQARLMLPLRCPTTGGAQSQARRCRPPSEGR